MSAERTGQSARDYPREVLSLLEYLAPGDREVENYCASIGISPTNLDEDITAWCGRSAEEFLYFASPLYSRQQVRGNADLFFDAVGLKRHVSMPVVFSPMKNDLWGNLEIRYNIFDTALGRVFYAETENGVVYLSFGDTGESELELRAMFPGAKFEKGLCERENQVISMIAHPFSVNDPIAVCTKCTPFQQSVWTKLLETLPGTFTTYGDIAESLGDKNASRAVGSALGANPVAWLIPCHRVVNADGSYGHFRWGPARKKLFLAWEAAHFHHA